MLDSPDNSYGEEEEDDPVTVEDPTHDETVLLEVPPGLVIKLGAIAGDVGVRRMRKVRRGGRLRL